MKHKALVILLSLTSLLCSFKTSDSDLEQLYIEDINSLDPNMDKAFCTGDSTFDLPNELSCSNPMTMLVIRLIQFVFGRFFPCALKSIVMIFSGLVFGYGTDCEMGLFYSKYTPLGYVIR